MGRAQSVRANDLLSPLFGSSSRAGRSLPARKLAASAVAGLIPAGCIRFIQKERTLFSSQTLLHGQRRRCSRAEASGASVCEPPQGGASARTAEAGFLRKPNTEQLIPTSQSALPPVAYSSLLRSCEQFTIHNFVINLGRVRLRTIPSKEENNKRSAVKHLYRLHTDSSSLCSSE